LTQSNAGEYVKEDMNMWKDENTEVTRRFRSLL
jgi:hypothetical protein